jgi:hypothetical protein
MKNLNLLIHPTPHSAIGKVGATVGTLAFEPLIARVGTQGPFLLQSGIAILAGIVAYICIPHVKPESLELEDIDFKAYLEENGFDTAQFMGDPIVVPIDGPKDLPADRK